MYGPSILQGAGFPSADGWYATVACPHMMEEADMQPWVKRFVEKSGRQPSDYSITAYDAVLVVIDAIERLAKAGKPIDRVNMRDAIAETKLNTLQGEVSFDENGDLKQKVIAVFQVKHDPPVQIRGRRTASVAIFPVNAGVAGDPSISMEIASLHSQCPHEVTQCRCPLRGIGA
jgi:ABC-type branched-subunit amino acid transport system substrate-binding protein